MKINRTLRIFFSRTKRNLKRFRMPGEDSWTHLTKKQRAIILKRHFKKYGDFGLGDALDRAQKKAVKKRKRLAKLRKKLSKSGKLTGF